MCKYGDTVERFLTISERKSHSGKAYKRTVLIDECISPIVDALNIAGIETEESCCGHGNCIGYIALMSGQVLVLAKDKTEWDKVRKVADKDN